MAAGRTSGQNYSRVPVKSYHGTLVGTTEPSNKGVSYIKFSYVKFARSVSILFICYASNDSGLCVLSIVSVTSFFVVVVTLHAELSGAV